MSVETYTIADTEDLIKSLTDDIDKIKIRAESLADIIAQEGVVKAQNFARMRMPSSGGSYLPTIKSQEAGAGDRFSVKIYSEKVSHYTIFGTF